MTGLSWTMSNVALGILGQYSSVGQACGTANELHLNPIEPWSSFCYFYKIQYLTFTIAKRIPDIRKGGANFSSCIPNIFYFCFKK